MMAKSGDTTFICMNVNSVNDLNMLDNFCSAIDSPTTSNAVKGNCL